MDRQAASSAGKDPSLPARFHDLALRLERAVEDMTELLADGERLDPAEWEPLLRDESPLCGALHPDTPQLEACPYFAGHRGDHYWFVRPRQASTRSYVLSRTELPGG